ncbi:hypothetical protein QJS10_CPA01g00772 [Acorus calamus]|uniref:FYVE-type domain-containing protein n=1 Tax=Acorus calamus TaxID=4465 RepID=A0AAV9FKJ0_ACOCL|nr:hypothetical protein QJS10_CPA01g00772 [Acorus calamus]
MEAPEGRLLYTSISGLGEEHSKFHNDGDYVRSGREDKNTCLPSSKSLNQLYPYQFSDESDFCDDGYVSGEDHSAAPLYNSTPEVNLRNVLSGIVSILTGRNKLSSGEEIQQDSSPNISFLGSAANGDTFLHSSVYLPSAPPLLEPINFDYNAYREVLEAEPPEWLPDSLTTVCMLCTAPFTPLTRGRHHCRFCGGVFCRACTKGRCLLPVKFRERNPQRVCDICYDRLDPLQSILINSVSNAVQRAKHDVIDWTCARGWLNFPVGLSMEHEIYKSTNTLRSYYQASRLSPEMSIPPAILKGAKGLAILTVVKAGVLLTYKLGTGLVVARRSDGSWSAPSAIVSMGLGWGAQIGGELTDFIIVLTVQSAFVGVSLEGNIVATRMDTNLRFYGDPYLTTTDILLGAVERPRAAEPLYSALDDLCTNLSC